MKITDAASLGRAIRNRRKALGYTQRELADYCGCSTVYLSRLENGKETAELGIAIRVVNTLGMDLVAIDR